MKNTTCHHSKKGARKPKTQSLVVDFEVRRSSRVREKFNGFKPSGCELANCLGCNLEPPTLSLDTLQNIGTKMCQLSTEEVEEATLSRKKKAKPISKRRGKAMVTKMKLEMAWGQAWRRRSTYVSVLLFLSLVFL